MESYHWSLLYSAGKYAGIMEGKLRNSFKGKLTNQRAIRYDYEAVRGYLEGWELEGVKEFLEEYEKKFWPAVERFEKVPMHGNLDLTNIIVDVEEEAVQGFTEFNHCCLGYQGFDCGSLLLSILIDKGKIRWDY